MCVPKTSTEQKRLEQRCLLSTILAADNTLASFCVVFQVERLVSTRVGEECFRWRYKHRARVKQVLGGTCKGSVVARSQQSVTEELLNPHLESGDKSCLSSHMGRLWR